MQIVVIGPNPPCIRCTTTFNRAVEVAKQLPENEWRVEKVFTHSPEADKYGRVECGHEIELIGDVQPDRDRMKVLLDDLDMLGADVSKNAIEIDRLLRQLDVVLYPVRQRAEDLGCLMTPVVIINGKVTSAGYVPTLEKIRDWVISESTEQREL